MLNDSSSQRRKRKHESLDVLCNINVTDTVASGKLEQDNHENVLLLEAQGLSNKNGVSAPTGPAISNKVDAVATMDDVVMLPYADLTLSQALPRVTKESDIAALVSKSGKFFLLIFFLLSSFL